MLKNDFESQNFAIFGVHKQTNFALGLSMLTEAKRMNGGHAAYALSALAGALG